MIKVDQVWRDEDELAWTVKTVQFPWSTRNGSVLLVRGKGDSSEISKLEGKTRLRRHYTLEEK